MWLVIEEKLKAEELCKGQNCIGIWNVRFMNQSKLDVVKQEMAIEKINILEIAELKWTGMGILNSDDHYMYYCGQKSLRRNWVSLIVNKGVQSGVIGYNRKNNWMNSVCFQGKPFSIKVIHVYASNTNAKEAEVEWSYDDLQDLLELKPKEDVLFIIGD